MVRLWWAGGSGPPVGEVSLSGAGEGLADGEVSLVIPWWGTWGGGAVS